MLQAAQTRTDVLISQSLAGLRHAKLWMLFTLSLLMICSVSPVLAVPSFATQTGQSCVACHAGDSIQNSRPMAGFLSSRAIHQENAAHPWLPWS